MSRNLAASIRARLKQQADTTRQDFNLTLTRYGLELAALSRDIGLANADVETLERVPAAQVGTLLNPKAG